MQSKQVSKRPRHLVLQPSAVQLMQDIQSPTLSSFENVYLVCAKKYCDPHRVSYECAFISERRAANYAYVANLQQANKIGHQRPDWVCQLLLNQPDFSCTNNMTTHLRELLNAMNRVAKTSKRKFLVDTQLTRYYILSMPYQKLNINDSMYAASVKNEFQRMEGIIQQAQADKPAPTKLCGLL